jgi:hypothetical protein
MGEACSTRKEMIKAYKIVIGKLQGKRPLDKPRCSCVVNIRIYIGEMEFKVVNWIYLTLDTFLWRAL